jgi:hypothetical protein
MARVAVISSLAALLLLRGVTKSDEVTQRAPLKVGVASVSITPFGPNRDWDGTVTDWGVWGEKLRTPLLLAGDGERDSPFEFKGRILTAATLSN